MQGEFMASHLPPNAKVVYLMGESSLSVAVKRWEGFKEACLDKRPDVKLLASVDGSWSKAEGMKAMTLWLSFFPEINGVVAANDEMALGAIQALKAANRLSLILGIVMSRIIADNISAPLNTSIDHLNAVATGDLNREIPAALSNRADEIGVVVKALMKMQGFMKQVHEEAEKTDAVVGELEAMINAMNNETQDMSAVTEEMSAGMEETAASTASMQQVSGHLSEEIQSPSSPARSASSPSSHRKRQRKSRASPTRS